MPPSSSNRRRASDSDEDELLALHRLDTGPRSASQQLREQRRDSENGGNNRSYRDKNALAYEQESKYGPRHDEGASGHMYDDEDEEAFLQAVQGPPPVPPMDKTGRPEWLQDGIQVARASRRVRLLLAAGTLLLLACIFGFVFSGVGSSPDGDGRFQHIYTWAGNIWHGSAFAPSLTSNQAKKLFPIDVGYAGLTQEGKSANLATEDKYSSSPARGNSPIETNIPALDGYNPFMFMGPLTPYRSANDFSISTASYRALDQHCQVKRVHILHRHGSRYPTKGSPANDVRDVTRNVRKLAVDKHFKGVLSFLNDYDPDRLGLELLVPLGRQQLFDSGVQHAMEYGSLISKDIKDHGRILVRSGSQQRIVDSALSFLQGIHGPQWQDKTDVEVQIEAPGFNTTLAPNFACPNADKAETTPGFDWASQWDSDYLRGALVRLKPLAPGVELTAALLNGMQQLCSYDTVAFGYSDFCPLFTEQEWRDYEYSWDLKFYGGYGDGSPVGKAQGLGWVNEMMSRLTRTPWEASTQTTENRTLNDNPITFPVDRRFYADFTHDSTIAGVIAALNLPDFKHELPIHKPDPARTYHTSEIVPYAARLAIEEITCKDGDDFVRLLLNEAIVDLGQLPGCTSRPDGKCARSEFIKAMASRQSWSDWSNCTKTL